MVNNLIQTLLVPVVVIVGLVVLIALHDLDASVGVPIIAGLAGVHLGANVVANTPASPSPPGESGCERVQTLPA